MAQKRIATTTANQIEFSKLVRAAFDVSGESIAQKAEAILFKRRKPKGLDLVALIQGLDGLLEDAEDRLQGAAEAHADELADDDPIREERDEAKLELNSGILSARSMITGAFGAAFTKRVGLAVLLEERPDLVRKIGAGVVRLLRKTKQPKQSFAGSSVKLGKIADELEGKVERLAGLLDSLKKEEREAQQTMIARDQAAAHWRNVLTLSGAVLEGLARIAGEHELADRVRPTERRRAGIVDATDTDATDTDATDTDATDTDATDTDAIDTDAIDTEDDATS